ncbi:MAG: tetratricopeptide repeat protein [Chloroflexi bacterium]|nr:tetratricopeptide repeat protein [Chloroflexota bacterium]
MQTNEDAGLTLKSLRALLRAWHHPASLGRHPLIRSRLVQARRAQSGEDEVAALRAVVQDAIARLRPTAPPRDPAWRGYLALTAHYLEGRPLDAIAAEMGIATVSCRRALKDALEALAADLRRAEATILPTTGEPRWPVNTAPSVAGPLVGRAALLARLAEVLRLGYRRIAVHGLPGVGKTRLLAQLANAPDVRAQFPDGVLWAGLGPQPDSAGILATWGLVLGLSWHDLERLAQPAARASALRQLVNGRRVLFILDDVWSADALTHLLIGGPHSAVVIATRWPDLAAEFAEGLACVGVPALSQADSISLLHQLVPQVGDAYPDEVAQLATASAGLPLTLTLIGRALRRAAHAGQARRVRDALSQLRRADQRLALTLSAAELLLRTSDQPMSLRQVLALSLERLSMDQQRALVGLSILPPDPAHFDEPTALAVLGAAARCRGQAQVEALDALVDAGLVAHDDRGYSIHASIAELLLDADDAGAQDARGRARAALVDHVMQWAASANERDQWSPARWPVVIAGAQAALALGAPATIAALVDAIGEWLLLRGHLTLLEALLAAAEADSAALSSSQRAALAVQRAQLMLHRGEVQQAIDVLRQAIAQAGSDAPEALGKAYTGLARAHLHAGEMAAALAAAERGLGLASQPKDHLTLLAARAAALGNLGRYEEADAALRTALAEAEHLGDTTQQIALGINLGVLCRQRRRHAEAERHLTAALDLARAVDFHDQMAQALICLGIVAVDQGNYARARALYDQAMGIARQLVSLPRIVLLEHALGVVAMRQGQMETAGAHLGRALDLAEQHQLVWFTASVRIELGEWHLARGELDQAASTFTQARTIAAGHYPDLEALATYGLAQVEAARGNVAAAEALGSASLAALRALSHYRADEVADWLARLRARPDATAHGEGARTA